MRSRGTQRNAVSLVRAWSLTKRDAMHGNYERCVRGISVSENAPSLARGHTRTLNIDQQCPIVSHLTTLSLVAPVFQWVLVPSARPANALLVVAN
jgi:hypothetical protein